MIESRRRFRSPRIALAALLLLALAAGTHARFSELGRWGLFDDEFYQTEAALTWLREGAPRLPAGGYYTRGILYQLADMASVTVFGDTELAHRLPSALAGLMLAGAGFMLARRRHGVPAAVVVAAMILLSSWHIEYARTARMYSLLALVSCAYFAAIEHARESSGARPWIAAGACVAVSASVQAASAILGGLFVLTVVCSRRDMPPRRFRAILAASVALGIAVAAWDRAEFWPESVASLAGTPGARTLSWPRFSELLGLFHATSLRVAWALFAVGLVAAARIARLRLVVWPTVLCCAFLQPVMGWCLLVVAGYLLPGSALLPRRRDMAVLGVGTILAAALLLLAGRLAGDMEAATMVLDSPRVYWDIVRPMGLFLPGTALVMLASIGLQCAYALRFGFRPQRDGLAMSVLIGLIAVASIRTDMSSARYFYFLYVPMLVATIEGIFRVARAVPSPTIRPAGTAVLLIVGALFFVSRDCIPYHWVRPADPEIEFRLGKYRRYRQDWYRHFDYRALADAARAEIREGERLFVTPKSITMARYFDRGRLVAIAQAPPATGIPQPDGSIREMYSGIPLLAGADNAVADARNGGRIVVCGGFEFDASLRELLAAAEREDIRWRVVFREASGDRSLYVLER